VRGGGGGGGVGKGGGKGTKDSGGGSSGGVYEVTILNTNLPSRRKKQISLDVNKALGPRMTSVVSPNKTKVRTTRRTTAHAHAHDAHDTTHSIRSWLSRGWGQVWAVELPVQVLRELVACAGGIGFHQPIQKYPRFKDAIIEIMRDGTHPNRKELILTLCWLVGEYASSSVSHLCTPRIIAGTLHLFYLFIYFHNIYY
jgi:hypothetical protein